MRKTIVVYILISALFKSSIGLFAPAYPLFLRSLGMTLFDVNIVNAFFYLTLLIFEFPTGFFADRFGRKLSACLGLSIRLIAAVIYIFAHTWWQFVLAEICFAVGFTFFSGAFQAWFMNQMQEDGGGDIAPKVFGLESIISSIGIITTSIICSYIVRFGFRSIFFAITIIISVLLIFSLLAMRPDKGNSDVVLVTPLQFIQEARKALQYTPGYFLALCCLSFIYFFSVQGPNMQWQEWALVHLDNNPSYVGFMFTGIYLLSILGSGITSWFFQKKCKTICSFFCVFVGGMIVVALGTIGSAILAFPVSFAMFGVHQLGRGGFLLSMDTIANKLVSQEKLRATLLSVASMGRHIGGLLGLLASGAMAQHISVSCAWVVSGAILFAGACIILWCVCIYCTCEEI